MAEKRPLQSGQNVDTCAVCDHCKCLSNNLNNCDRCGARLEKDKTAVGYSSETNKRQRLENGDHSNGLRVNGDSRSRNMNPSNQPVPQALYMNTSNISTVSAQSQVRPQPQALYVNMNHAYPNLQNSVVGQPGSGQNFSAIPTSAVNPQMAGISNNINRMTSMSGMPGSLIQGQPMYANNQLPVGNLQNSRQPPPYSNPNQPRSTIQMQSAPQPSVGSIRQPQPGQQQSSSPGPTRTPGQKVSIMANQIRIGLRKFTPSANVVFKQEGVMFTLKEYPNAPLLLNARAIVKCKANMVPPFPAFFFYLESSCVKQIRSIFTMREDEFSEKSSIDKVRCISIFPTNIATKDARTIQETFLYMKTKYQRQDSLLENCTSNDILDIFYGTVGPDSSPSTNQTTNNTQNRSNNRNPSLPSLPSPVVSASSGMVPSASPSAAGTNLRTLVLPDDPSQWQAMQKTLVVGRIYAIQTRNGERKFCTWNGSTLVPWLVHDHEVQLQCVQVRIGSLKAHAVGIVRVINDKNKQEISFQFKGHDAAVPVTIPLMEIVECLLVCTDRIKAIFIYGNPTCCNRVRTVCRMGQSSQSDPYYNVTSKEERHKHLILFLKDLNADQKGALLKMKNATTNMNVFSEIDILRALKVLSDIKTNSVSQSRIDDYFGRNANAATDIENQVLSDVGRHDKSKASAPQDDDDDDVIMTQEEIGIKCPYTQQVMQDPMRNKICGHNYEKVAIMEFISRKKLKNIEARCPYAGCGNTIPLRMEDLEENHELRDYIQRQRRS